MVKQRVPLRPILAALGLAATAHSALAAVASNFLQRQQTREMATSAAAMNAQANSNLRVFALGVQKYVYANVGTVPWNVSGSTNAISYTPFLLYAAGGSLSSSQAEASCGFAYGSATPPGFTSPINLEAPSIIRPSMSVSWAAPTQYLPANWSAPLAGVDCAAVWINQPSAQQITIQAFYAPAATIVNGNTNVSLTPVQMTYGIKSGSSLQAAIPGATVIWSAGPTTSTRGSAQGQANGAGLSKNAGWQ